MPSEAIYQSLGLDQDDIRLLTIEAGAPGSEIWCRLQTASLLSSLHYEALSYEWGGIVPHPPVIHLNGTTFNVQPNLFSALQSLRHRTAPRVMWIDAICINQQDLRERQNQVQKMTEIYTRASRVVVWIGEETVESAMAFEFMDGLPMMPLDTVEGFLSLAEQVASIRSRLLEILRNDRGSVVAARAFFDDVFQRNYWNRVWIIQEVALGAEVMIQCGRFQAAWDTVLAIAINLHHCFVELGIDRAATSGGLSSMGAVNSIRHLRELGIQIPIGDLLAANRTASATKDVDYVFGLLGVSRDTEDPLLTPDYNRTEVDVYTSLIEHHATVHRNLDLISLSLGVVPVSPARMASWVPDWPRLFEALKRRTPAERRPVFPIVTRYQSGEILGRAYTPYHSLESMRTMDLVPLIDEWNATLGKPAMAMVTRNPDILMARGICVDKLANLGAIHFDRPPDGNPSDWDKLIQRKFGLFTETIDGLGIVSLLDVPLQIEKICTGQYSGRQRSNLENSLRAAVLGVTVRLWRLGSRDFSTIENRYIDGSSLLQAYVTTILAGRLADGTRFDTEDYTAFWTGRFPGLNEAAESHRFLMIAQTLKMGPLNRRLAVSGQGYLLTCTANAEEGDFICVLYGCSVPVVLRKVDDHYLLVGDAYVHGLMDGQVITQLQDGKLFEEDFCIY